MFGAEVTKAVKEFQTSVGIKVDGKVGSKTRDMLFNRKASIFNGGIPTRSLSSGCRGYDVFVLQEKLVDLNFLKIAPSGYYNSDTLAAVKALETANGLKTTGKAGPIVRRYLWPSLVDAAEQAANNATGTVDDPYVARTLKMGMYGSDVANAQMRLKAAGYLFGNADGIFGAQTEAAVLALQKDKKLKQDGKIGPATWSVINQLNVSNAEPEVVINGGEAVSTPTDSLRRGNRGALVKKLQQALITLGYLPAGEDDGIFGAKTYAAVYAFQKAQGLKTDGVAGTKTYVKLNTVLGVAWDS